MLPGRSPARPGGEGVAADAAASESAQPDILLLTLDTTRADALGCYVDPDDPRAEGSASATPHLDALAQRGVLFENCSASSAITPVSHASILTGREPYQHGLRIFAGHAGFRLHSSVPTLATRLRQAGYRTVAVHSAFPVSGAYGLGEGYELLEDFDWGFVEDRAAGRKVGRPGEDFQRRSDATVDLALERLPEQGPLFLWVHLFDPHDPQLLPPVGFMDVDLQELPPKGIERRVAFVPRGAALPRHPHRPPTRSIRTAAHGAGPHHRGRRRSRVKGWRMATNGAAGRVTSFCTRSSCAYR